MRAYERPTLTRLGSFAKETGKPFRKGKGPPDILIKGNLL
ncbi:keywimysin-related RiPP [Streptomyces sp. NPDC002994]